LVGLINSRLLDSFNPINGPASGRLLWRFVEGRGDGKVVVDESTVILAQQFLDSFGVVGSKN
jgi:hypothetical protein